MLDQLNTDSCNAPTRDLPSRLTRDRPRIPLHILADNIRSVFNVGGILRTADAAGIERVHICGYTATTDHKGVMKSSRGAEEFMPVTNWPDARSAVHSLKEKGFSVVGLEPGIGSIDYRLMRYRWPLCIVLGNEATGISPAMERLLDDKVEIPMHGGKSSLNVVVALGVVLFHIISTPDRPEPILRDIGKPQIKIRQILECLTRAPFLDRIRIAEITDSRFPFDHVIVISSARVPEFRMWCDPVEGGIHIISRPILSREPTRLKNIMRWHTIKHRGVWPHSDVELKPDLPDVDRSLVYASLQHIAHAEREPHMGKLRLDSVLYNLIQKIDTIGPSTVSMIGRYQSSTDHVETFIHGRYLLDLLLRSYGGTWRTDEVLLEPPSIARHPLVGSLLSTIRKVLSA